MSEHKLLLIRESISLARSQEAQTGELLNYLSICSPQMHQTIQLPQHKPAETLLAFITRYVEQVPDFLEALAALLHEAKIYEHGKVFLTIAEDFFLSPPAVATHRRGMHELLDEAYLAHRLMEEVNDRMLMSCGVPLIPMDTTLANVVVHDLLGDHYANQLDLAVHFAIETLFDRGNLVGSTVLADFIAHHNRQQWEELLKRWPCLAGDSLISLEFSLTKERHLSSVH